MTSPTEPTDPRSENASALDAAGTASAPGSPADAQPTEAYSPADAQPTEAYVPVDQPTAVYPPADAQPTEAYGTAGQGQAYGQPVGAPAPYGAPAYGAPAYAAPAEAAASGADRPRGLAWASLGLAIGGVVLVSAAFLPLAWGSLALALVGGLLLLVALVLGIVTLVSKKQGGKGLGIGAIAVSVLGGFLWIAALTVAFVWIGLSMAGSSSTGTDPEVSVSEEAAPEEEGTDEGAEETPTGTYDEAAYLAAVKPGVLALMQEIEPSVTEELVGEFYTDDMLVASGQGLLLAGEAAEEAFVSSTVESSQGMFTEDQAQRFYDLLVGAAEQYLVE